MAFWTWVICVIFAGAVVVYSAISNGGIHSFMDIAPCCFIFLSFAVGGAIGAFIPATFFFCIFRYLRRRYEKEFLNQ
jgi:hypothetical protein